LNAVKTKVMFNLTKRQILCFGGGALIGVPLFFLLKGGIGTSPAAMVMMVVMIPAMLFAMYEKNGQPLEVVLLEAMDLGSQRRRPLQGELLLQQRQGTQRLGWNRLWIRFSPGNHHQRELFPSLLH
jgi:hypothetical protein